MVISAEQVDDETLTLAVPEVPPKQPSITPVEVIESAAQPASVSACPASAAPASPASLAPPPSGLPPPMGRPPSPPDSMPWVSPPAQAQRVASAEAARTFLIGYLGGSRSADKKARMTSSRLFSLISSSAKRVGRSSCGASTGVSLKKVGAPGLTADGGGVAGATGTMRGGAVGRVGCPGARVTAGSGCPGVRGEAEGGAGCHTGCCGGLAAGTAGFGAGWRTPAGGG